MTVHDFIDLNDYNRSRAASWAFISRPITGNQPFISGIMKGEYKEWAPFIMRTVNTKEFLSKAVTGLPIDGECVYSATGPLTNHERVIEPARPFALTVIPTHGHQNARRQIHEETF